MLFVYISFFYTFIISNSVCYTFDLLMRFWSYKFITANVVNLIMTCSFFFTCYVNKAIAAGGFYKFYIQVAILIEDSFFKQN